MNDGKQDKLLRPDTPFGRILTGFAANRVSEVSSTTASASKRGVGVNGQGELQFIHYASKEGQADFALDPTNETVWATQAQIAGAFGIATNTVTEHLRNIFTEGELDEASTTRKFPAIGPSGREHNYLHYNLEAILSVGYRVSGKRATAFRQWATKVLKDYIVQGFALDEQRLRDDPNALRELAARVRTLRADEKNIYHAVRDVFAFTTTDYLAGSQEAKTFYTRLQDKFLHAVTGLTAAEIKLQRADHRKPAMGLTDMKGSYPKRTDADVGKNYLQEDELYTLHILCEQFLLFVESSAIRGKKLTMAQLNAKFDELLRVQGHEPFLDYKGYIAQKAKNHAMAEFDAWVERTKSVPIERLRQA